ncbi:hypothetical protein QYM36_019436 [Artemia franciscana]|uniref:YqaJ viral recombinase domain-containing protein n=1 Tax=Artemia franciscana TaxID=6661 RepID=A0AA88H166_ARTSF|nr:hypothetical protein QYM36_019436 [Artemia franciscana]
MTTVTNPLDEIEQHAGASDKDREAWLAERRAGVTATEVRDLYTGAKQMQDLIDLKLGRREDTFTGNAYTRWGTEREPVIAEKLAGEGVTFDGDLEVIEIKTASTDLPPGSPELEKKGYVPQIQWNLWVLGASRGRLVVEERLMGPEGFEAGRVFRHWIERDDAMIRQLVQIADEFLAELDRQRDEGRPVIDEDVDTHALNYLRGLAAEKEGKALKESAYRALIAARVSQESPFGEGDVHAREAGHGVRRRRTCGEAAGRVGCPRVGAQEDGSCCGEGHPGAGDGHGGEGDKEMTALATLPKSSDTSTWSPEERALVEAAGLVHTDAQSGTKTLAERPVVAAFLQHCARTGLDPIARQIYSIARKSKGQLKWQIQISIDGARLVAERTGQYEGQTTPEFTADGATLPAWGVYRRGFREALYAVALWDAYVQTKYNGEVSDMWSKMGPLMLAKCAEMLALRKAFPQDLSGLYTSEEMDQASSPSHAPVSTEAPAQPRVEQVAAASDGLEYRRPAEDWLTPAVAARSRAELRTVFEAAGEAGDLNVAVKNPWPEEFEGAEHLSLNVYLRRLREPLPETVEDVVDAEVVDETDPSFGGPASDEASDAMSWPTVEIPNGDQA